MKVKCGLEIDSGDNFENQEIFILIWRIYPFSFGGGCGYSGGKTLECFRSFVLFFYTFSIVFDGFLLHNYVWLNLYLGLEVKPNIFIMCSWDYLRAFYGLMIEFWDWFIIWNHCMLISFWDFIKFLFISNAWAPRFVMSWEYIEYLFSPVACQLNDLLNHLYSIYFIHYLSTLLFYLLIRRVGLLP